ncbi:LuxR C-terminal-related transcriptional regulator [Microbacterium invictum]|uniref:LuxR family maltose regulon positive regulatory protein n=1 Tax=Microbacterium invictum TaxID=515415 RepID=A0AA40SLU4_9MICO|nr:LuxR C-terminal-related transcriptional regulator [Microbacterium invictum]MBB4138591.1 LuxR family maltose regulon positive regulatory protein [Microbacterium invictum]
MPDRHRVPAYAEDRPRLREQLDSGLSSPLSLVVAPAGAGKTVLLAQWVQSRPDLTVAWLDITAADNEARVFAHRLIDAIDAQAPGFHPATAPVESTENRLGESLLEDLAAGMKDAGPVVIILDDLDRLSGSALLTDLWRLVDLVPSSAHFVFSSRTDLNLGWSRHRLQHNLVEIRQRELAFDRGTTASVIASITGHPVSDETADAVVARTEGWAVGVQLTALSLRFAADPVRVVDTLADTDRLIVDYLSEEVLDAQQPGRTDALTKIAVLDDFCAPLLNAIFGAGGSDLIADLVRDSMFVVPVPERPGWYRFHRLFRDLLRLRVRAQDAAAEAGVLEVAGTWCEAEGLHTEAIEYHLRAHAWDRALDAVFALRNDVYETLRLPAVAGWLSQVPPEVRDRRPQADLLLAIAWGISGHGTQAVDALRSLLTARRLTTGERQVGWAYLAACVQLEPHPEFFADAGRRALRLLHDEPATAPPELLGLTTRPLLLAVAEVSLGRALLFLGDLAGARRALQSALRGEGMAYRPYRIHAKGTLALIEALSGRLTAAGELADDALELAAEFGLLSHPAPADAYLARALAAIRRGESEAGAFALTEGTVRAAGNSRTQLVWLAHLASLTIDPSDSVDAVAEPPGTPPPIVRQASIALSLRRARLRGTPTLPAVPSSEWSVVAFEEVAALLALGQPVAARERLSRVPLDDDSAPIAVIEVELLRGWMFALEGRGGQSRVHLQTALARAAPERLVYPFLEAGPDVAQLIEQLPGPGDDFRRLVIARGRAGRRPPLEALADKLTPRELELLAYLPSRLTFADIAAHSFVSINTIKTHIGHIYRKLGVTDRDSAIERAVDLGLIDPAEIARVG